ncbi:MAG: hypothetical protein ACJAQT_004448 [Akkermansiaceae bacterium]|jgi:hypothetical protein
MVPTPIIIVGDAAEHTVIEVPYVSGFGLDFSVVSPDSKPIFFSRALESNQSSMRNSLRF